MWRTCEIYILGTISFTVSVHLLNGGSFKQKRYSENPSGEATMMRNLRSIKMVTTVDNNADLKWCVFNISTGVLHSGWIAVIRYGIYYLVLCDSMWPLVTSLQSAWPCLGFPWDGTVGAMWTKLFMYCLRVVWHPQQCYIDGYIFATFYIFIHRLAQWSVQSYLF